MNDIQNLITEIQMQKSKSLSSVSIVPSIRGEEQKMDTFVQGIEKFIDAMNGKNIPCYVWLRH